MAVPKLCSTVPDWPCQEYLPTVRRGRELVGTTLLHAFGRAYGVPVLIIQSYTDENNGWGEVSRDRLA